MLPLLRNSSAAKPSHRSRMDLVTGVVSSLALKSLQLLHDEWKLQESLRKHVESLSAELESIRAFLCKVADVPWYQLDEQVKVWAREVRDKCYDVEDALDSFLVLSAGHEAAGQQNMLIRAMNKVDDLFTKAKARRDISSTMEDLTTQLREVAQRRQRYKIGNTVSTKPAATRIDPRLSTLYTKPSQLVGIDEPRDALIEMLLVGGPEKKIVSIVGVGGLGKTTLAMAVYDKLININPPFDCCAFIPVGQNPDHKKILRDILIDLTKSKTNVISDRDKRRFSYGGLNELDARQLIDELREYLKGKRYFIVVDDIWETSTWTTVDLAFVESNCGSRILTTTRNSSISMEIGVVYRLDELSDSNSKKLFYMNTFGGEEKRLCSNALDEVSDTIIQKCRGVPLAIVTISGVLARKQMEEWSNVYDSIGFDGKDDKVEDMKKILSYSYYDLPSHLRTCLLYLSIFPEEHDIEKRELILRWIAEGFVYVERRETFFDVGESYLHELINRNLVTPTLDKHSGLLLGCRIHDMLHRLIRQLSTEENFVVALANDQTSSVAEDKVRRLAFFTSTVETRYKHLTQVRSFNAKICFTKLIPAVSSFKLLRVLALEFCIDMEGYPTEHIGKLLHLRYIALSHTPVRKLPKNIGDLKFLQTLLLDDTGIIELPGSLRCLKQLMCLCVDERTRVPEWIGQLTSLVELEVYHEVVPELVNETFRVQKLEVHHGADNKCSARQFVKELGNLRNLRSLTTGINLQDQGQGIDLLESLKNLNSIQNISISLPKGFLKMDVGIEPSFSLSSSLRSLQLLNLEFSRVPAWMNGQYLPKLCQLTVVVSDVEEEDLESLGTLPELRNLVLVTIRVHRLKLTICGCGGFKSLISLEVHVPLLFVPGAMPRLENIKICMNVMELRDANISFDFCLENLSSLKSVTAVVYCAEAHPTEVEEAEAAIRHAVDIYPNHPALSVIRSNEDKMGPADADSRIFSRQMYKLFQDSTLNEQIKKLNKQIDVQNHCNSALNNQAQEMARAIPKWHPSIAKIQWSSASSMEIVILRKQLADTAESMNDQSDSDQLMQHIKVQDRLLELYNVENKRMAAIKEELKAMLRGGEIVCRLLKS